MRGRDGAPGRTREPTADYGLRRCSTGACTERPSCRSCSRWPIAAFSLGSRPAAAHLDARARRVRRRARVRRTAAPGRAASRSGARAAAAIEALARVRRARRSQGLGGTAGGGFSVHTLPLRRPDDRRRAHADERGRPSAPGSTSARADPDRRPPRRRRRRARAAELSGTAALLELARVFAARETKRTIVLASTSGGSGGDAGAAQLLPGSAARRHASGRRSTRRSCSATSPARARAPPFVVPFSDGLGSAPLQLQRTVADAITQEAGVDPGAPEHARPARAPRRSR